MEFPTDTDHISLPNTADANRDLIKTFTDHSDGMIIDDVLNAYNWVNRTSNKKLDQDIQQNYNEIASEMIPANNAELLSQLVTYNEIRDSLILEKNY